MLLVISSCHRRLITEVISMLIINVVCLLPLLMGKCGEKRNWKGLKDALEWTIQRLVTKGNFQHSN